MGFACVLGCGLVLVSPQLESCLVSISVHLNPNFHFVTDYIQKIIGKIPKCPANVLLFGFCVR